MSMLGTERRLLCSLGKEIGGILFFSFFLLCVWVRGVGALAVCIPFRLLLLLLLLVYKDTEIPPYIVSFIPFIHSVSTLRTLHTWPDTCVHAKLDI